MDPPCVAGRETESQSHVPIWLLGLLSFSSTVAMHIFVPALPFAAADLGASIGSIQLTISLYICGLAIGQVIYGPISDRYGRRRTMIGGLSLYTVAGFVAVVAPNLHILIAARFVQALGGSVGLVLARAIVRDSSGATDAARRLATLNLMVIVGPGLAPILGGFIAPSFGWRAIFALICVLGAANLLLSWRLLPETKARGTGTSAAEVARHYGQLVRSPAFLGFAIGGACATTSMYGFISASPFIFVRELHRPSYEVGIYLTIMIFGVWSGSALASQLLRIVPVRRLMIGANAVSVLASFVLLGAALTGHLTVAITVGSMFVFTLGAGIASPAALTQSISVNPFVIGSASGLYGFAQMATGAICTALAASSADPALGSAMILAGAGILAQLAFWVAMKRHPA